MHDASGSSARWPGATIRAASKRLLAATLAVVAVAALAGCRLVTDVGVSVHPDGTGSLALRVVVDGELVAATPNLATGLQLQDAATAGWTVNGPEPLEGGGLMVTLSHGFGSLPDATTLLASLGPPFDGISLSRTQTDTEVVTELHGRLTLPGGSFEAFADTDLLGTLGGAPFGDELASAGATPATAMTVELRVELPGRIVSQSGGRIDDEASTTQEHSAVVVWRAPLDGSVSEIAARAVFGDAAAGGGGLPGWIGTIALVAAVVWLAVGGFVAWQMWQAQQRRRHRRVRRSY